jgi:hypothetical protein
MLNDPQTQFTAAPQNVMKTVLFMNKIGTLKTRPQSWKDLFFPEIHQLREADCARTPVAGGRERSARVLADQNQRWPAATRLRFHEDVSTVPCTRL